MSSSVGMIIPNIWKVIKFMFQTTNQIVLLRLKPYHPYRLPTSNPQIYQWLSIDIRFINIPNG